MKKTILVFALLVFCYSASAQQTITGTVTSASDGLGLPGVTVVIKDIPGLGTITDMDGNYSIEAPEGATHLVFSFIGMKTEEIEIAGRSIINLVMEEEAELLESVIVTAIGIKVEKKSIGYAAQEVKADALQNSGESNIVNALSSKVAGVEVISSAGTPGASSNITIRGRTSLRNNNSPLFVVDGVPIDNSYSGSYYVDHSNRAVDLNSDDIESVTVLKGASAAALYGIRAANGAVLITTKSGKGEGGLKKNISLKTSLSFDVVNRLPEKQSMYAQGSGGIYDDNVNTSWGPLIDTLRYDGDAGYPLNPNGRIVGMSDPTATANRVNTYNENLEDFFQTAVKHNTHFSMSGGSELGSYYFSAGHLNQTGVIPNSDFKRTSFKITGDSKLTDRIKISGSANYTNSGGTRLQKGSNLSAVLVGLLRATPTFDLTNGSDDPVNDPNAYTFPDGRQRYAYRPVSPVTGESHAGYDNPYWSINKNIATDNVNRLIGYSQANADITKWLKAMYRVGLDFYSEERETYLDNQSADIYPNGYISINTYDFRSINSDFLLTAEHDFSEDLKFTANLGHNFYSRETYSSSWTGDVFVLPNLYDISNTEVQSGDDTRRRYKIVGAFYDIKLAYKRFLYFNTTGRNDWSSTLPPGKNSFFYPSFNVGFIFTDAFDLNIPAFNYGKIRASYAQVGNDADPYSLENYYTGLTDRVRGQLAYATVTTMGNVLLEPEKTTSLEMGVDLRFYNNKLGLDFAIYQSKSIGQIVDVPVAYSTGFRFLTDNAGVVTNNGIEVQLFATPVETSDLSWDIMLNFTKNENLVEELPEGVSLIEFETTGLSTTRSVAIEGEPYGVIYGGVYLRNENDDIIVDSTGLPLIDSEAGIAGDPNPDFTVGLRNTLTYKGFSLSALLDIRKGGALYNGTRGVMLNLGTHKETENRDEDYIFPGVINEGTEDDPVWVENNIPIKRDRSYYLRMGGLAGLSEMLTEDASWVRLREVSLSYSLPKKWFDNNPISSMNLGITGRNLLLFTELTGIDPETNLSGAARSMGIDYFNMPNTKGVEINLQVTF